MIVSIPGCSRCGQDSAPDILLNSDYTCEKCLTALSRRTDFLNGIAG